MYLLDTDWMIQALARRDPASRTMYYLANGQVHVSMVSVGALYDGAFAFANPQMHLAGFRQFLEPYRTLDLNDEIMERFAEIRSFLRRQGQLISDFDILIAATALHHNLTLLTFNLCHFQRIPHLKLFRPA